jgi:DNA adenine methylase
MARTKKPKTIVLQSPIPQYGGKYYIASRILSLVQPHTTYVEPFCGGAQVYFHKSPSSVEILNDLNPEIINFFRHLRADPDKMQTIAEAVPHSKAAYDWGSKIRTNGTPFEQALGYLIMIRMSYSKLCRSYAPATGKPGAPQNSNIWTNSRAKLRVLGKRLKNTFITCRPALDVVREHLGPYDCLYLDPPYVHSTRVKGSTTWVYFKEMTNLDHEVLLETVRDCEAQVILSGYDTGLYNDILRSWNKVVIPTTTNATVGTKSKRLEVLWYNRGDTRPHRTNEH